MSVFKKKKKRESLGEVSTASTSDISFLLLIFFIVSTIFAEEMGLVMILPGKQKTSSDVPSPRASARALLSMSATTRSSWPGSWWVRASCRTPAAAASCTT